MAFHSKDRVLALSMGLDFDCEGPMPSPTEGNCQWRRAAPPSLLGAGARWLIGEPVARQPQKDLQIRESARHTYRKQDLAQVARHVQRELPIVNMNPFP